MAATMLTAPFAIPDFNYFHSPDRLPIEELQIFIADSFRPHLESSFTSQMEAAVCIIAVLLIMGSAVIWRRMKEKSFWLFRKDERKNGVLIVPNAVTTFLLIQFIFGAIWICYAIQQILVARGRSSPVDLVLWVGLIWLPLIQGAWFAGWGTFFASPLQVRRSGSELQHGEQNRVKTFLISSWNRFERLRASMLNSIVVMVPLMHAVVIVTLTALAEGQWRPAVRHWQRFDHALSDLISQAQASPIPGIVGQVTPALNGTALSVWRDADAGFQALESVWWAWVGSAFAFTSLYSLCGGTMLFQLMREVSNLKRRRDVEAIPQPAKIPKSEDTDQLAGTQAGQTDDKGPAESTLQTTFWPPILSHPSVPHPSETVDLSTRHSRPAKKTRRGVRYATMRKVTLLVGIQVVSISAAAFGFSLLALGLALKVRPSAQHHQFAKTFAIANEIAAWLACVFGGVIFVAITARTFEHLTDVAIANARNRSWTSNAVDSANRGSRDRVCVRASHALSSCLHPAHGEERKREGSNQTAIYSRNHRSKADESVEQSHHSAARYQDRSSRDVSAGGGANQRRSGNANDSCCNQPKLRPSRPFYATQTIFQDDTIGPIDEEQSSELYEGHGARELKQSDQSSPPLAVSSRQDGKPPTVPATVWVSLASRFTPISSADKRLAMVSVFEDDTLSPEPGEADQSLTVNHTSFGLSRVHSSSGGLNPHGTVPLCIPRLRSAETLRHDKVLNAKYRDDGLRGFPLGEIPHSTASLTRTSSLQSRALLPSRSRRSLTTGEDWTANPPSLASLPSVWQTTPSAASPTTASVESYHLAVPPNAMLVHPMPLAARELVREALQNIPPGLRSPSRMGRAGKKSEAAPVDTRVEAGGEVGSTRQGHLESVRNLNSSLPEDRPSSPSTSPASRDGSASTKSWITGLKRHSSNDKPATPSASCHVQASATDRSISSPRVQKPPPLPVPASSAIPLDELSPISSGGHDRHDDVLWINGHRIDPHEPHADDARDNHSTQN